MAFSHMAVSPRTLVYVHVYIYIYTKGFACITPAQYNRHLIILFTPQYHKFYLISSTWPLES
jgi:hypothetical protein